MLRLLIAIDFHVSVQISHQSIDIFTRGTLKTVFRLIQMEFASQHPSVDFERIQGHTVTVTTTTTTIITMI